MNAKRIKSTNTFSARQVKEFLTDVPEHAKVTISSMNRDGEYILRASWDDTFKPYPHAEQR